MIHPLHFFIGYEIMSVSRIRAADFFNLCSLKCLSYHQISAPTDNCEHLYFRVSPLTALKLRKLCKQHGIELTEHKKSGLPFILANTVKRPGIILGVLLMLCVLFAARGVIWDVRIEGNQRVSDDEIISLLKESGIGIGTRLSEIDVDGTEMRFLVASDKISWIAVNITGTVADVEVREREPDTPDEETRPASNLVASANGTVIGFEEVRGDICVELGEDVSEGQLLVSGVYGSDTSPMRFTRAKGKVFALCEREYLISVPLNFKKKTYTGRQKIKNSLIFFEKEVKFFGNSGNSYATCDTINRVKYLDLFGLGKLPFGIRTVTESEYVLTDARRTEAQAEEQANLELWQKFSINCPDGTLASKKLSGKTDRDYYKLYAKIESVENIAVEKFIELDILG